MGEQTERPAFCFDVQAVRTAGCGLGFGSSQCNLCSERF